MTSFFRISMKQRDSAQVRSEPDAEVGKTCLAVRDTQGEVLAVQVIKHEDAILVLIEEALGCADL